jgi:hypothetical protein
MANEHLTKKSVPSSASRAASGVFGSHRASRQGTNAETKSGRGHFAGAMLKLAKLRQPSRSVNPLQQGNVLTKQAPMGGMANFDSNVNAPEGNATAPVKATEGQTALNPKQRGASSKNMQRDGRDGRIG